MASDISAALRRLVAELAGRCCEYCLLPREFALRKHEPDHIVPRQHGGETNEANLCRATKLLHGSPPTEPCQLSVSWPAGSVVVYRGSPFAGSFSDALDALRRYGVDMA